MSTLAAVGWAEASIWIALIIGIFAVATAGAWRGAGLTKRQRLLPRKIADKMVVVGDEADQRVAEELGQLRTEIIGLRQQVEGLERVLREVG